MHHTSLSDDLRVICQSSFVSQGEICLFESPVVGHLEKWIGPLPDDVCLGIDPPSIERATVQGDFYMSAVIQLLQGTPFDSITFRNVVFYHQNYALDTTKSIGWHFNGDWIIDPSCGPLYEVLTQVLQVERGVLSVHASFGHQPQSWDAPLNLHSFILEGTFPNMTVSAASGLTLTSIGVQLLGIRGFSSDSISRSTLSFGFDIFGEMKLDVPGSNLPSDLHFEMGLVERTVNVTAEMSSGIWKDALGVKGLVLEDVVFMTSFDATFPWPSLLWDVSATFSYMSSQAPLQGSYTPDGFSLTAALDSFDMDDVGDIFFALFSETLVLPDCDVYIKSAVISVTSGRFLITLHNVNIMDYTAASIEVALTQGASLSGALSSSTIKFSDVELRGPVIKLSLWPSSQQKNADITLSGVLGVDFLDSLDSTFKAVVHLYPDQGGVEWVIVTNLVLPGRPFVLSDAVPEVKSSFLDVPLKNAVLIAASKDDLPSNQSFPDYHVLRGVHVFGVIDCIPALSNRLRRDTRDLLLHASWSKTSGFDLVISLPAEATRDLGSTTLRVNTDPVELAVLAGERKLESIHV